jgi:hypothetical protein
LSHSPSPHFKNCSNSNYQNISGVLKFIFQFIQIILVKEESKGKVPGPVSKWLCSFIPFQIYFVHAWVLFILNTVGSYSAYTVPQCFLKLYLYISTCRFISFFFWH